MENNFNSASWQIILQSLSQTDKDSSLIEVIRSYFSNRRTILETEEATKEDEINSVVPHGPLLGPTFRKVLYDGLLPLDYAERVMLIGFAVDITLVEQILMDKVNTGVLLIIVDGAVILKKRRKVPRGYGSILNLHLQKT